MTLFNGRLLSDVLTNRTWQAETKVRDTSAERFRSDPDGVEAAVIREYDIESLTLDASKPATVFFETTITQRDEFSGAEHRLPGMGVRATAPFTGDASLLDKRPSSRTSAGAPSASYSSKGLTVKVEAVDLTADVARSAIKKEFERIQQHFDWVNSDLEEWRRSLRAAVHQAVTERVERLDRGSSLNNLFD